MGNYEAAWKALKIAVIQKNDWKINELFNLVSILEIKYDIGAIAELIGKTKEVE